MREREAEGKKGGGDDYEIGGMEYMDVLRPSSFKGIVSNFRVRIRHNGPSTLYIVRLPTTTMSEPIQCIAVQPSAAPTSLATLPFQSLPVV